MSLTRIKRAIKRILRYPPPPKYYKFVYTPAISQQKMTFTFSDCEFSVEADGTTPLYETISEIIEYDCYYLKNMDFARFSKDSIAVDVGAHIGIFSLILSPLFPGKIVCLEPVLQNYEFLKRNVQSNPLHQAKIELLCESLSLHDGRSIFYKGHESVSGSLCRNEWPTIEVDSISVQTLWERYPHIDLLKLDIEGAEHDIIPELLSLGLHPTYITAEIHDMSLERNLSSIVLALESSGYQVLTKPEQFERPPLACLLAYKLN